MKEDGTIAGDQYISSATLRSQIFLSPGESVLQIDYNL
jgi:hypothetical protein